MNSTELNYLCPHCNKDTTIFIEFDSTTDYYADLTCGNCTKEIKDDNLDIKIMEEVQDWYIGRAEYYRD